MKTLKIFFFAAIFSFVFNNNAQAQIIDSFPWFKAPSKVLTPKIMDWDAGYNFAKTKQAVSKSSSVTITGKKIKIPSTVRLLNGPITLTRGNNCYQISCDRNKDCKNCQMFWKDLNRDRKIQPRLELRCVCAKSGDNCGLKGRKVECK